MKGSNSWNLSDSNQIEELKDQKTTTGTNNFMKRTLEQISQVQEIPIDNLISSLFQMKEAQPIIDNLIENKMKKVKKEAQEEVVDLLKKKQKDIEEII